MTDVDGTCEYVLDSDDPETWGGEEGDVCYVPKEALNDEGVWECPHSSKEDNRCIFHLPIEEKDNEQVMQKVSETISHKHDNNEDNYRGTHFIAAKIKDLHLNGDIRADFDEIYFQHSRIKRIELEGIKLKSGINFSGAKVTGETNFSGSEFEQVAGFKDIEFDGKIDFSGAKFEGVSGFPLIKVKGNADFGGTVFSGESYFQGSEIEGVAEYSGSQFNNKVDFSGIEVDRYIIFQFSEFEQEVNFSGAKFGNGKSKNIGTGANFYDVQFGGDVNFDEVEINGRITFSKSKLGGDTSFFEAEFNGQANFQTSKFVGEVNFSGATFQNDCYFNNVNFQSESDFRVEHFCEDAIFQLSEFYGNAYFVEAVFSGEAKFGDVEFNADAGFQDVKFESNVSFFDAVFNGDTDFIDAQVKNADFRRADISGALLMDAELNQSKFQKANLTDAELSRASLQNSNLERSIFNRSDLFSTKLHGSSFYGAVFGDAQINEETEFGNRCVYDPEFDGEPIADSDDDETGRLTKAAGQYRIIEQLARTNAFPDMVSHNFIRRQDIHRENHRQEGRWGRWLRATASKYVLEYGENPWRLIATGLIIVVGFGLLYPLVGGLQPTGGSTITASRVIENPLLLAQSIYYSTLTFTTLGMGDFLPVGLGRVLTTLETSLGAIIIALLVFVFGRRAAR